MLRHIGHAPSGCVAGVIVVVGSLMPWATLGIFSVSGVSGDGRITIVLAVLIIGCGVIAALTARRWSTVVGVILALVTTAIAVIDIANISSTNRFLNSRHRAAREVVMELVPDRGLLDMAAARAADRDEMWSLLQALAARQRAALVLRYCDDLADDEIARALHCRVGAVRSLISRGLAALRQRTDRNPDATPRSRP